MGLDLVCGDISIKMGSYSNVHNIRAYWIKAEIIYQKQQGNYDIAKAMEDVIKKDKYGYKIDYEIFNLLPWDLGTEKFVYHSDCDGIWTSDESKKILETLDKLRDIMLKIEEFKYYFCDGEFYLEKILKYSMKNNKIIYFC
jgi:hypothetical protein